MADAASTPDGVDVAGTGETSDTPHPPGTPDTSDTPHLPDTPDELHAPDAVDPPDRRRAALSGVRAMLLDMDGVVVLKGAPLPGAAEAVRALSRRGTPFRVLTNSSLWSRDSLSGLLSNAGIEIEPAAIVTALSASAALTRQRWPGRPLYVLAAPDALREFDGQRLLTDEEAAAGGPAAAVVVGDAGPGFTWQRLNAAFRLVRGGARLVAMHRNPWWLTPDGVTLDSGAFVRALEFATGRHAFLVGKPAGAFFHAACESLGVTAGSGDRGRDGVLMVGDDLRSDVAGAKRAGLRAAFVLSGRHGPADLAAARTRDAALLPDVVAGSLAEVVAALD
jgi:HAD superfamily hydrolase (TIGR01458 family)